MGIKDCHKYIFCDNKSETIEHLLWYCDRMFPLWSALANWIWEVTKIEADFTLESVLMGYANCIQFKKFICP